VLTTSTWICLEKDMRIT